MGKVRLINFLDTASIIDRLELEARKAGMNLEELWGRIKLDTRTMNTWRTGQHTPSLSSLQHIQSVINDYIREKNSNGELVYDNK